MFRNVQQAITLRHRSSTAVLKLLFMKSHFETGDLRPCVNVRSSFIRTAEIFVHGHEKTRALEARCSAT